MVGFPEIAVALLRNFPPIWAIRTSGQNPKTTYETTEKS
jgi:hypothetical protein